MKFMEDAITTYGEIIQDQVVKVDAIINHQVDVNLMQECANAILAHYKMKNITKVVTIESSGIAPALFCAQQLQVPMVFFKKSVPSTLTKQFYTSQVHSFTKNIDYQMCASSDYLKSDDRILLVDDFLANGEALMGAIDIIKQANATIEGIAVLIEKAFQGGHKRIEEAGYELFALASIKTMQNGKITFQSSSHEE